MMFNCKIGLLACCCAVGFFIRLETHAEVPQDVPALYSFESGTIRLSIGSDGRVKGVVDKKSGTDYADLRQSPAFVRVKISGKVVPAVKTVREGNSLEFTFGIANARVVLHFKGTASGIVVEVVSVEGQEIEECIFVHVPLKLKGNVDESFAACALALTLNAKVSRLPGHVNFLDARCYPRFGFAGAKVVLVGGATDDLRGLLQAAIKVSPELPHSPIGGPWALDAEINRGSYLFANVAEKTVDDWIKLAQSLGINQIDFDGMSRYGDAEPYPHLYPNGLAGLKQVVEKVQAAGLKAGLHTYAFFIDKRCPWITPVPDARLAKAKIFTLDTALSESNQTVTVAETTVGMSAITGFFVRNSATLQIGEELIVFSEVSQESPYIFTKCKRGAYGTKAVAHAKGSKAYHLKECFGRFLPDPNSTLLAEVAERQAKVVNECGFDMMYLDALDGQDTLGGRENGWYYGSKFVFELWKRFDHPVLLEMSTMHHHLWRLRSRMGAWDHPRRSQKSFVDIHVASNTQGGSMLLPMHLGWWAIKFWEGTQVEQTFPDDIEYLCCKAIANDVGWSLQGVRPGVTAENAKMQRLGEIMRRYEKLRHSNTLPQSTKERLKVPGAEFKLDLTTDGQDVFLPAIYDKHMVEMRTPETAAWTMTNMFPRQPLRLRLELLMSAAGYDDAGAVQMIGFQESAEMSALKQAKGVMATLVPDGSVSKDGLSGGCLTATNDLGVRRATWAGFGKKFTPPLNLGGERALGVWVYGDGQGAVLNFQLQCPSHVVAGWGEHYVVMDFKGWRYFELIEPSTSLYADYVWPYGGLYGIYRSPINYKQIQEIKLWVNNLPAKGASKCHISPVRALPLIKAKISNPRVKLGGHTLRLPVELESGCYLEVDPDRGCAVFKPDGNLMKEISVAGDIPVLESGENRLRFECDSDANAHPRVKVTVMSYGLSLQNK
ncbi:MAG: hypothetical protein WC340_03335 [Kiritimatiellia bacterium]